MRCNQESGSRPVCSEIFPRSEGGNKVGKVQRAQIRVLNGQQNCMAEGPDLEEEDADSKTKQGFSKLIWK